MFQKEQWFAWFPVVVTTLDGKRTAWLETVIRERASSKYGVGPWRYYQA